jgi:hypothetical protein
MHPMVLRDDEVQVEGHFSPFGDIANLDSKQVHGLRRMNHWLKNCIGCTQWNF